MKILDEIILLDKVTVVFLISGLVQIKSALDHIELWQFFGAMPPSLLEELFIWVNPALSGLSGTISMFTYNIL